MKLYSYVVEHDNGKAPNPYFGFCTLCRCKYRRKSNSARNIVELAQEGEENWIIGTGGSSKRSAGHGKLIYAMRVDRKITRGAYFDGNRFAVKKAINNGTYEQSRGDNEFPKSTFEKEEQFVLISEYFYYFGRNAVSIPKRFKRFEKKGPGFRSDFNPTEIRQFIKWLETKTNHQMGKLGEPCYSESPSRAMQCKSCF